ncbi:zinc ribbon domain-containing protein [Comamonas terrigena]|uniref:zinc ribbon domain-containing protein n=1 Tax=Comamonas terrigena TaxID=32013 RepID=UPI0035E3C795
MSFFERLLGGHHRSGDHHGKNYHHGRTPVNGELGSASGTNCPKCRNINSAQSKFCQQCGTGLIPSACNSCGSLNQVGARFCNQCGKSV